MVASLSDGGHVKVLDENVRNIKFRLLKGRPAMILDLHGTACGKLVRLRVAPLSFGTVNG